MLTVHGLKSMYMPDTSAVAHAHWGRLDCRMYVQQQRHIMTCYYAEVQRRVRGSHLSIGVTDLVALIQDGIAPGHIQQQVPLQAQLVIAGDKDACRAVSDGPHQLPAPSQASLQHLEVLYEDCMV